VTPLDHSSSVYLTAKRWKLKPSVVATYAWGDSKKVEQRQEYIRLIRLLRPATTESVTEESINDFSLTTSVRYDFWWREVWDDKSRIRFTPQLSFTSGTQKYGMNRNNNTYLFQQRTGGDMLYQSDNDQQSVNYAFEPLAVTLMLRTELSWGKFFIQPQFAMDYFFPADDDRISSGFNIQTGFVF
jgi:hypothetical protein